MGSAAVEEIMKFLVRGDQLIQFSSSREIILVLGDTGTGKTTFTHFLALNNNDMISEAKGRGDYVITDNTKGICDSTIDSCTVIPEMIIDKKSKTVYYDCPGFSDTRSPAHDIGASYFVQKVISRVDSVKIIFTISYDSVRQGGDRRGFMDLAQHINSSIADISKWERSICLVVTKVDNIVEELDDDTYKLVSDDVMVQNIVGFLLEAKRDLESKIKTKPLEDEQFNKNTVTLIDILTRTTTKIGIFRRPNKKGPLSTMKLLQKGKISLQKMIYEQLQYTPCNQKDFGYAISDHSKLFLTALKGEINENINENISEIGKQIMDSYSNHEKTSSSIDDLIHEIAVANERFSNLQSEDADARTFVKKIATAVDDLKVEIPTKNMRQALNHCGYLEFIEAATRQPSHNIARWGNDLVSYLSDTHDWYRVLIKLRATLSEYAVQQDLGRFNDVKNQLMYDIANNRTSVVRSVEQFLSKIGIIYEIRIKLDEIKLMYLGEVIKVAFGELKYECIGKKLVVKGNIIKMKDVVKLPCYNEAQILEIFGLQKIFFDVNIHRPQGQLRMFVPELEVVGEPTLTIDGVNGLDYTPAKAASGSLPGSDGAIGHPGYPGGSAGGFLGVGIVCNKCDKLSISGVGGKGGRAQHGGDGVAGKDGRTPDYDKGMAYMSFGEFSDWTRRWASEGFQSNFQAQDGCPAETVALGYVFGEKGQAGGKGGDGGRGGEGGHAGQISVLFQSDSGHNNSTGRPKIITSEGTPGDGGIGGKGGQGGKFGNDLYVTLIVLPPFAIPSCFISAYEDYGKSPMVITGNSGSSNKNTAQSTHPETLNFHSPPTMNQYKDFLRQHTENRIIGSQLKNLLEYMEVDPNVNIFYNAQDLVDDLLVMERHTYSQQMSLVNVRSYKNFLDRIKKYAQTLKAADSLFNENKLVIGWLYTSILSKLFRFQESSNIELVVDVKGYLRWVIDDINQLADIQNVVKKYKSKLEYQGSISTKVDEANTLINNEIMPEISNSLQQLQNNMQSLLNETIALEEDAEAHERELIAYKKRLESQMGLSIMFGIFQGIGVALGFLGPVGAMIGSTIGVASMVAENLANDITGSDAPDITSHLPGGVEICLGVFQAEFKKKYELYKTQLSKADDMLKDFKDDPTIVQLEKKIALTQTELNDAVEKAIEGDLTALEKSYQTKKDLDTSIKGILEQLKNQKDKHRNRRSAETDEKKKTVDKQIEIVSKIQNILQMAEVGVDIYEKVSKAKSSIRTIDEAINQAALTIAKLRDYEKAIYSTILPLVEGIKDTVDTTVKTLSGKSLAALDVSSWTVQSSIRQVARELKEMTNGFKTQDKFENTIDKVTYGINTMIRVYDRIQDYFVQAQLADFIYDITSDKANSVRIHVSDTSLQEAINDLTLDMQTNIVLAEYERAMNTVRQYYFPFGNYLEQYDLPVEFKITNTSLTISNVVNNIVTIFGTLERDTTVIQNHDKNIFPKQIFNSRSNQSEPFYVWEYNSYEDQIRRMFRGEEIMLNADITRGIQQNAMKFDRIGVYFKAKCSQLQAGLDRVMDGFSVKLTHLGNSYYRCDQRVFTMTHGTIDMQHSVNKVNGEYYNQNAVYEKIKSNSALLSPYGMWKMQLVGQNFYKISRYIGQKVNIELEGRGSFLSYKEDDVICTDLKRYYQEVTDTIQIVDGAKGGLDVDDLDYCDNLNRGSRQAKHGLSRALYGAVEHKNTTNAQTIPISTSASSQAGTASYLLPGENAHNSSAIPAVNYNLLDLNGSLLLMDTVIRNLTRRNLKRHRKIDRKDEDYAHLLAYSAHAP